MEIGKLSLFSIVKNRLNWLAQRQEVLAQNIANSDTPRYKPSDLKPYNFEQLVRQGSAQLNLNASGPNHIQGIRRAVRDYATQVERRPFETSPNGNAVVLEEQMAKLNETQINHSLTTELYKKHLNMIKMAIGK